jgi:hypothetical protein
MRPIHLEFEITIRVTHIHARLTYSLLDHTLTSLISLSLSHDPLIRENMITHTSEFSTPPEEGGNQKCPGMDGALVAVE